MQTVMRRLHESLAHRQRSSWQSISVVRTALMGWRRTIPRDRRISVRNLKRAGNLFRVSSCSGIHFGIPTAPVEPMYIEKVPEALRASGAFSAYAPVLGENLLWPGQRHRQVARQRGKRRGHYCREVRQRRVRERRKEAQGQETNGRVHIRVTQEGFWRAQGEQKTKLPWKGSRSKEVGGERNAASISTHPDHSVTLCARWDLSRRYLRVPLGLQSSQSSHPDHHQRLGILRGRGSFRQDRPRPSRPCFQRAIPAVRRAAALPERLRRPPLRGATGCRGFPRPQRRAARWKAH